MAIFISYRREDSAPIVDRIAKCLTEEFDRSRVFRDVESIAHGDDLRIAIRWAVSRCDVLLAVIGRRWAGPDPERPRLADPEDYVRLEIGSALARDIPVV